ncbi:hypothetical protein L218DRAFT_1032354, partial [Marasmius fiardii PR-910]
MWWTHDLMAMKKKLNQLCNSCYKLCTDPDHAVHRELREHLKEYSRLIMQTQISCWEEFLEDVTEKTIYTASKYAAQAGVQP